MIAASSKAHPRHGSGGGRRCRAPQHSMDDRPTVAERADTGRNMTVARPTISRRCGNLRRQRTSNTEYCLPYV
eukprot:scaffold65394_cov27-Tisochrysis_lutea.AAC.5